MEWQLFEPGTVPEYTTPQWYAGREHAPHLEQEPHRSRLLATAQFVQLAIEHHGVKDVIDLGAGDGGLLSLLTDVSGIAVGFDLQQTNVDYGRNNRMVNLHKWDVVAEFPTPWCDPNGRDRTLVVMTEMLEHLVDPHGFLRTVAKHAQHLVASSPYKETGNSHYGFHTWAWDKPGYRELMAQAGYQQKAVRSVDIFQVVSAEYHDK